MKHFNLLALFVATVIGMASCKKSDPTPEPLVTPQQAVTNVTTQLNAKPELSTFSNAFKNVPLSQEEVATGITVFAPTNNAIAEYDPAALSSAKDAQVMATDSSKLTQSVLKDHIVKGILKQSDFTDGKIFTSLSGKEYKVIRKGDTIRVNGVRLTFATTGNSEAIYTVDKLLTKTKVTDVINNPKKVCLISKVIYVSDTSYVINSYDSQNRLVKEEEYYKGKLDEWYTYTYSPNQIVLKIYEDNVLEEQVTYALVNGLVTSSTMTEKDTIRQNNQNYIRTYVSTTTYQHNSEGFLTKMFQSETSTSTEPGYGSVTRKDTTSYTYRNGNLVQEVRSSPLNGKTTTTYEYYLDKPNSLSSGDEEFFLTKPNKNPLKKSTRINSYQGGTYTDITSYTYEYNAENLITKRTESYGTPPNSYTYVTNYEYNCK
jgi:uncharacterized surface protein with fasciclin (FAS1) repeats